ncbi:hypothetical protein HanRHA438_Chr02g0082771 [Helianthus annuus]|nr:hypothetical protein HanRHA438_Chr02g0082771 [Helianthus annuus]
MHPSTCSSHILKQTSCTPPFLEAHKEEDSLFQVIGKTEDCLGTSHHRKN